MALYVGDGFSIVIEVIDPVRQERLNGDSSVDVALDFYAPGKDPKGTPADRVTPDLADQVAVYDAAAVTKNGVGAWVVYQASEGGSWVAGKWSYRVRITGAYQNVEYGTFTLKA